MDKLFKPSYWNLNALHIKPASDYEKFIHLIVN